MKNILLKENIFRYGYHDSDGKYAVVLDEDYIKEFFKAERVYFKEPDYDIKN